MYNTDHAEQARGEAQGRGGGRVPTFIRYPLLLLLKTKKIIAIRDNGFLIEMEKRLHTTSSFFLFSPRM